LKTLKYSVKMRHYKCSIRLIKLRPNSSTNCKYFIQILSEKKINLSENLCWSWICKIIFHLFSKKSMFANEKWKSNWKFHTYMLQRLFKMGFCWKIGIILWCKLKGFLFFQFLYWSENLILNYSFDVFAHVF
jgi:hypothetical protein